MRAHHIIFIIRSPTQCPPNLTLSTHTPIFAVVCVQVRKLAIEALARAFFVEQFQQIYLPIDCAQTITAYSDNKTQSMAEDNTDANNYFMCEPHRSAAL